MSTFGLTWNLKSPDRNKQFISNIPRIVPNMRVSKYVFFLLNHKNLSCGYLMEASRQVPQYPTWDNILSDMCIQWQISLHILISLCCLHDESLHPWLSKMHPVKIWSDCVNVHAHQNPHWAPMPKDMFLGVAARMFLWRNKRKFLTDWLKRKASYLLLWYRCTDLKICIHCSKWNESQHEKMYLPIYAPYIDSNQPLHSRLSKMQPVKILIRLHKSSLGAHVWRYSFLMLRLK